MNYIIHYDIAALVVNAIVIFHFIKRKNIATYQQRFFAALIWGSFISNIFDLLTIWGFQFANQMGLWLNYAINQVYLLSFNITPAIFCAYIYVSTRESRKVTLQEKLSVIVPFCVSALLILTTPLTHWVFYFDKAMAYKHGSGMYVLYLIAFYYLAIALVNTQKYRYVLTRWQNGFIYFYTISCIIAVAVQMVVSNLLILQYAISLAILLIYLSMENPDSCIDKRLGVFNRIGFFKQLGEYIDRRFKFTVMCIQLEGFYYINETVGVNMGERLLREVSAFIQENAKDMKLFHISEAQFALVGNVSPKEWDEIVETVHNRFKSPFTVDEVEFSLSSLICMLNYPDDVDNLEDLIDTLQYSFAEFYKTEDSSVIHKSEDILTRKRREQQVLQIIKAALRENRFEVYYQPIYDVKKQKYTSAEALVRLKDNSLGYISPEEFIPIAEKNGLILEIGNYVFRSVCSFMAKNSLWDKGIEYIEVNLSVIQCMRERMHEQLISVMDEFDVHYNRINLEITETAAVISKDTFKENMRHLMDKGITFALDDYGTGFSNTANIISYPFNIIKLDKSMIWSAADNDHALCALKHTVQMIKEMNMKIVAEGVETKEQAAFLADMGCDYFQGFYYSKPVPESEFLAVIKDGLISKEGNTA